MHRKSIGFIEFIKKNILIILLGFFCSALISAVAVYAGLSLGSFVLPCIFSCAASVALSLLFKFKTNDYTRLDLLRSAMISGTSSAAVLSAVMPALISASGEVYGEIPKATYSLSEEISGFDTYFVNKKIYISEVAANGSNAEAAISLHDVALPVVLICICAFIAAVAFSFFRRKAYVSKREYDFPEAVVGETVMTADKKGVRRMLIGGAVGAVITLARELISTVPFSLEFKGLREKTNIGVGFALSPLIGGLGYIAGFKRSLAMMIGAIAAHIAAVPIIVSTGIAENYEKASSLRMQIGLGLLVGAGLGTLLDLMLKKLEERERIVINDQTEQLPNEPAVTKLLRICSKLAIFVVIYLLLYVGGLSAPFSLFITAFGYIACHAASALKGETGITGSYIIIGISATLVVTCGLIFKLSTLDMFLATLFIGAACAFSGELTQSYKMGHFFATTHYEQLTMHIIGAIGSTAATLICFFAVAESGDISVNPAATLAKEFFANGMNLSVVWLSAAISAALVLLRLPAVSVSLGVLMPFSYTACFFVGGLVRLIQTRAFSKKDFASASGLAAGECTAIVLIALVAMLIGV